MSQITDTNIVRPTRRSFLRRALGAGAGAALLPSALSRTAKAAPVKIEAAPADIEVLNFALHLEYLEAQYYTLATTGLTLEESGIATDGTGTHGTVTVKSNPKVTFNTTVYEQAAAEITQDEQNHVKFLRAALGTTYTAAQPDVDLLNSFNVLAVAAGLGDSFDPFENEINFLLGAFIFEDVGVTAYRGGSAKIVDKSYLKAAAGILAVEALHAGEIRAFLLAAGMQSEANAISVARNNLDPNSDLDQGVTLAGVANIAPTDANSLVFSRNIRKTLNIVFGAVDATSGGFFPSGVNL